MVPWERAITSLFDFLHLRTLRSKLIAFAVIATLIPSLVMGWLSYSSSRQVVEEKVNQELTNLATYATRELALWFKEQRYETRVFAGSGAVSDNLERISQGNLGENATADARLRIEEYLRSVGEKFPDYRELLVVDLDGNVVATSSGLPRSSDSASDWLERARSMQPMIGSAHWDEALDAAVIPIGEPVRSADERLLGILAAKLDLRSIGALLETCVFDEANDLSVITHDGEVLSSTRPLDAGFLETKLASAATRGLFSREVLPLEFTSIDGAPVVGALKRVVGPDWAVVAEKNIARAYAPVVQLRNRTLLLICLILLVIGLATYLLGLTLVPPLDHLIQGAAKVSLGDLDVDLPVVSKGEVGFLTEVFNHMVLRLRESQDERASIHELLQEKNRQLHELSITDALTGLRNRMRLTEILARESARSRRRALPFSILMIDIDHFKTFNDSFGHQAGDEVLRRVALLLAESTRDIDYAVRYGGEEFLVLLTEIGAEEASQTADRIRELVERERIGVKPDAPNVTVSVGIASFPEHGDDAEAVISRADSALYEAKRCGRNRVVLARAEEARPGDAILGKAAGAACTSAVDLHGQG